MKYYDIYDIELENRQAGYHFFDKDTLRFFRSRIGQTVYQGEGGIYFVTSEQFVDGRGKAAPRKYTVRQFFPDTKSVNTVGEFNELTSYMANKIAKELAEGKEDD